ncbi:MAG: hypothetical protein U9P38_05970, partial [Campylobacterota bacterium]|nr:hypothetical protein [Campylobacterota bacterium]
MMIIMRILFIYLLFYSSIFANSNSSNKLHVTFELMKGKIEYMDILEHKKEKFDKLGFKCYFFKKTKFVSLRCNDTKTVENYNKNIQLLKENNIKYKVISLEEKIRKRVVKEDTKPVVVKKPKPLTLGDGYRAYDKKRYTKANVIFLELYEKRKNVETSYALALVAFQREKFEVVRNYLKPYRTKDKKASKLYYDSIVESYLRLLRMKKNDEAVELQKNYIGVYPKLSKLPKPKLDFTLDNGYKAYNKQEYKKAKKIFQQLYKYDKNLENSYAMSLLFLREKKYKEIRDFLVDYREEDSKSSKLFYDSILAQYYSYIKVGRVSRALDLQKEYIELYPALHHLIKPKLKYDLKQGYDAYNKEEFAKAFFIFSALYNRDNSLENSYAIALIAMKNREYAKVRRYLYDYQTQTNKTEKLYYDSILREYEEYMEKKEYIKAVVLLKSFKSQYPQLNRMQEALIIKAKLFIRDGEYYKAEELLRTNDFRDTRDFLFKEI